VKPMIAGELWLIYALAFGATLLGVQALYWVLYACFVWALHK